MGLTKEGKILAAEISMLADGGAYGCSTEGVMRKAAILGAGPYNIENLKMDTRGVYTNNTPSGAFRSFGALQTEFATNLCWILLQKNYKWIRLKLDVLTLL